LAQYHLAAALRRTATTSLQDTPSTALSGLSLDTPPDSPPSSLIPLHIRARGLLRATCNSATTIAGRQRERDHITQFLGSFLGLPVAADVNSSTLYISGLPGTGKTALCNDILRTLDTENYVIITVNCMALGNVDELWNRLQEDLGALKQARNRGRAKKSEAMETIRKLITNSTQKWLVLL
jgi:cell division control protein 6